MPELELAIALLVACWFITRKENEIKTIDYILFEYMRHLIKLNRQKVLELKHIT